jgi:lysophospholipase L1-like esterase
MKILLASLCLLLAACAIEPDDEPLAAEGYGLSVGRYAFGTLGGSAKCMDVASGGSADGTNIRAWTCNNSGAQTFRVEVVAGGVRLVNPQSGKCVDISGNGSADRTNVQLWTCNGTGAQRFQLDDLADGTTRILHLSSGKCVDVDGAGTQDGTNIQLWTCNNTVAQRWRSKVAMVRILPLGASITQGVGGTHAGYRGPLDNLLDQKGVAHQLVGSSTENPGPLPAEQRHHEGHPGFVIASGTSGRDGIRDHIDAWLGGANPDIVLILLGSNDVDLDYKLNEAGERMRDLLARIRQLRPGAHTIVASLPLINNATTEARSIKYNAALEAVVEQQAAAGQKVSFVDVHAVVTPADKTDNLHPNDAGYDKIGQVWLAEILKRIPSL